MIGREEQHHRELLDLYERIINQPMPDDIDEYSPQDEEDLMNEILTAEINYDEEYERGLKW